MATGEWPNMAALCGLGRRPLVGNGHRVLEVVGACIGENANGEQTFFAVDKVDGDGVHLVALAKHPVLSKRLRSTTNNRPDTFSLTRRLPLKTNNTSSAFFLVRSATNSSAWRERRRPHSHLRDLVCGCELQEDGCFLPAGNKKQRLNVKPIRHQKSYHFQVNIIGHHFKSGGRSHSHSAREIHVHPLVRPGVAAALPGATQCTGRVLLWRGTLCG